MQGLSPTHKYSENPKNIRLRMRKRANRKHDFIEEQKADIAALYGKPVEEWDFEELQMGQPRKPSGKFGKKRPAYVTQVVLAEAQRRLKTLAGAELSMHAGDAIRCIAELMRDGEKESVRLDAAKYILNQIVGIPTARIELSGEVSLKALLAECIVNEDGLPAHPAAIGPAIVDGDVEGGDDV